MQASGVAPSPARYIPELDGLRALAILVVMLFHFEVPGMGLGWSGVNLFFVISGFLITGILLDSKEDSHYFRNFYIRRVLRIFPIYYLGLLVMFLPYFNRSAGYADSAYYFLYLQNIIQGQKSFGVSFSQAYNHTWSLAIEEQFYLLWPWLVYKLNRQKLMILIGYLFLLAIVFRAFETVLHPSPGFLIMSLMPLQIDSLMAGSLLAWLVRTQKRSTVTIANVGALLSILSTIGIIAFCAYYGYAAVSTIGWANMPYAYFFYTLFAICFGGLTAFVILKQTWLSSLLRNAVLRHIGKISYGLYLYHYPVFIGTRYLRISLTNQNWVIDAAFIVINFALTYLLAVLSWRYIEAPLLKLKDRFAYKG